MHLRALRLDAALSRESVHPAPAPGDVEHLKVAEARREGGVDDEMVVDRLEAEQGAKQEQGCPR